MTAKSSTPISRERRRRRTKFSNDKLLSLVKRRNGKNQTNTQFRLVAEMGHGMLCPYKGKNENQMRRGVLGKSSQTFTPQKWEPSVQMGVVMLARRWQGGPMWRGGWGGPSGGGGASSLGGAESSPGG